MFRNLNAPFSSALYIVNMYKIRLFLVCLSRAPAITEELLVPVIMRELIDAITYDLYTDSLLNGLIWRYIGIILAVSFVFGTINFATVTLWAILEKRMIRNRLHKYYLIQPPEFYDKLEPTEPTMRCANSEQFLDILGIVSSTIESIVMCSLYIGILTYSNTTLVLIAIAPVPIDILVRYIYGSLLIDRIANMQLLFISMNNHTVNLIQAIDLIRNCGTAD